MLRLSSLEPEPCSCARINGPAAEWCSGCGKRLGSIPAFSLKPDSRAEMTFFDVPSDVLRGETPRLWLSGGPGAWYLTENNAGSLRARILDFGGFGGPSDGVPLPRLQDLRAISANRRGLIALAGSAVSVFASPVLGRSEWETIGTELNLPFADVIGLALAPFGQHYLLTREGDRLVLRLGSPLGSWRAVTSTPARGLRDSWLETVSDMDGNLLFWGGGIAGFYAALSGVVWLHEDETIADIPAGLLARFRSPSTWQWRGWNRNRPILVPLSPGRHGLLQAGIDGLTMRPVPEWSEEPLSVVSVDNAVLARCTRSYRRITVGETGASATVFEATIEAAEEAVGVPTPTGASFLVPREHALAVEHVDIRDMTPFPRDIERFEQAAGLRLAATGFEPLAIRGFSERSKASIELWCAFDAPLRRSSATIQRIARIREAANL